MGIEKPVVQFLGMVSLPGYPYSRHNQLISARVSEEENSGAVYTVDINFYCIIRSTTIICCCVVWIAHYEKVLTLSLMSTLKSS